MGRTLARAEGPRMDVCQGICTQLRMVDVSASQEREDEEEKRVDLQLGKPNQLFIVSTVVKSFCNIRTTFPDTA
jgi:hypothetical protein